jgi:hypothetical protein
MSLDLLTCIAFTDQLPFLVRFLLDVSCKYFTKLSIVIQYVFDLKQVDDSKLNHIANFLMDPLISLVKNSDDRVQKAALSSFTEILQMLRPEEIVLHLLPRAKILAYDMDFDENRYTSIIVGLRTNGSKMKK